MISIKFHRDVRDGRLATAEVHFLEGDLAGLKLRGFRVLEDGTRPRVQFPMNLVHTMRGGTDTLTQEILEGYDEWVTALAARAVG